MNNALQQKIIDLINSLQHNAPAAMSLVLRSIQMDAINDLLQGLIFSAPFFIVATWLWFRVGWPKWSNHVIYRAYKGNRYLDSAPVDGDNNVFIPYFIGAAIGSIIGIFIVASHINFWTFIALYHPDVWLAHLAVMKMG